MSKNRRTHLEANEGCMSIGLSDLCKANDLLLSGGLELGGLQTVGHGWLSELAGDR